ncbi:exosome nuclease subunit [Malassezia cuniculi]|uniref:Exosome nuclease subunit n=1 Tax=Malassezia cuniculi TaxID=948313 RepID=A0AAF0EPV3_9BASI|nr:exosome nuclease subunit [Malassezia cuniculi]
MEQQLAEVSGSLARATEAAAQLPGRTDLAFFCSIDPELEKKLGDVDTSIGEMLRLMHTWATNGEDATDDNDTDNEGNAREFARRIAAPSSFSRVGDIVDQLLERADTYLDEYSGRVPLKTTESYTTTALGLPRAARLPPHLENASIDPPQRHFTTKPDNRSGVPWSRPLRLGKPNAIVPLGWKDPSWDTSGLVTGVYGTEGNPRLNPYHVEIQRTKMPESALNVNKGEQPVPLTMENALGTAGVPFKWVKTAAEIDALLAHLREDRVTEIAIDLEHNSKRSYLGIVCLMQLSTRWGDWIIDTLSDEVREHAEVLNEVFTSPNKVLVLHGADHDILWLQRDLGLYVTALFDTHHATNVLNMPVHSLAYLLQRYVSVEADKQYQLADWRIRPLPLEMLFYARSDTHSLLYIYDCLRTELLAHGGPHSITEVFERSKATATKVFAKVDWDENGEGRSGWRSLWLNRGGERARASSDENRLELMSKEERLVRALHRWRDSTARVQDEGTHHVLSDKSLVFLAFRAPETAAETLRVLPKSNVIARSHAEEITAVIANETQAWIADSKKRGEAAQAQLESIQTDGCADLGEAVAKHDIFSQDPQMSAKGPSMFAGMKSIDSAGALHAKQESAPKSLFELPSRLFHSSARAPAAVHNTLASIRDECAQVLGGLFGSAIKPLQNSSTNRMAALMGLNHVLGVKQADENDVQAVKEDDHHHGSDGRDRDQDNVEGDQDESRPVDEDDVSASASANDDNDDDDGDDDDGDESLAEEEKVAATPSSKYTAADTPKSLQPRDSIVKVGKKERWSREKKRQRKAQDGRQPKVAKREIEPFDYATASSVLDATDRAPAAKPQRKARPAGASASGTQYRSVKQKSDVRRGNKSGTFAK